MASFATQGASVADLFRRPDFWKSSKLLDSPTPLAKDFFDLLVKGKLRCSSSACNQTDADNAQMNASILDP